MVAMPQYKPMENFKPTIANRSIRRIDRLPAHRNAQRLPPDQTNYRREDSDGVEPVKDKCWKAKEKQTTDIHQWKTDNRQWKTGQWSSLTGCRLPVLNFQLYPAGFNPAVSGPG
jgi:hypothetical protein